MATKKKKLVEAGSTSPYVVLRTVQHDADFYTPGDILALTDAHAEPLVALGHIRPATDEEAAEAA
jgi:hypothetical protein